MVRVADDTSASDPCARMPTGTCTDLRQARPRLVRLRSVLTGLPRSVSATASTVENTAQAQLESIGVARGAAAAQKPWWWRRVVEARAAPATRGLPDGMKAQELDPSSDVAIGSRKKECVPGTPFAESLGVNKKDLGHDPNLSSRTLTYGTLSQDSRCLET